MPATTGAAAKERGARTGRTGPGMVTADGLRKKGKDDRDDKGADNLDKGAATAGEMADGHSARMGVPAANLIVARAEPRAGALVTTGETTAGTLHNLGGDDIRLCVPTGGDAKLPA